MGSELAADRPDVSVRVAVAPDDPIEQLRALKTAEMEVERWVVQAVAEARQAGRSWAAIGDALGVTRQAAWQLYNSELQSAIARARGRAGLNEADAMSLAQDELHAVRTRRRR